LNQANVQQAIHAQPVKWATCSSTLNYTALGMSMIPFYQNIFQQKPSLNILIYSGDVDIMTVPFAYTQQCLSELAGSVVSGWQPWFVNGWTAGYVEVQQQFTYATVKGAGHEVPEYQPLNAFNMFSRFLQNGNLADSATERADRLKKFASNQFFNRLTQGQVLRSIHKN